MENDGIRIESIEIHVEENHVEHTKQMDLNYKKYGEGHPLIILHGLFGMLDNWQTLSKKFAEHFTVYAIDQRNHGKSPHFQDFDYYLMSEDLKEFMDEMDLDSAYVLGHSMGGKTAMQFACDNESKVDKLIVVDIAPKDYPPGHEEIFRGFYSVKLEEVKSRKDADKQLGKVIKDFGVRQFLLKNLDRKDGEYCWKANLDVIHENYELIIANSLGPFQEFDSPTLFIKGGDSERYIELDDWAEITGYFSEAKLEIVEGAGHWVHAQKPEELCELVIDFLLDKN